MSGFIEGTGAHVEEIANKNGDCGKKWIIKGKRAI